MARRNFHLNIRKEWAQEMLKDIKTYQDSRKGDEDKVVFVSSVTERSVDAIESLERLFSELVRSYEGPALIGPLTK